MIIRTLAFVCDNCKVSIVPIKDSIDMPDGWIFEKQNYPFSGYEKHICEKCVEKREILEIMK